MALQDRIEQFVHLPSDSSYVSNEATRDISFYINLYSTFISLNYSDHLHISISELLET